MSSSIQLNGRPHPLDAEMPLRDFLRSLGLLDKPLVIELDGRALLRDEYDHHTVAPGATLEIITLAAGG